MREMFQGKTKSFVYKCWLLKWFSIMWLPKGDHGLRVGIHTNQIFKKSQKKRVISEHLTRKGPF